MVVDFIVQFRAEQNAVDFPSRSNSPTARDLGYFVDFNDDGGVTNGIPVSSSTRDAVTGRNQNRREFEDPELCVPEAILFEPHKIMDRLDRNLLLPQEIVTENTNKFKAVQARFPSLRLRLGFPRIVYNISADADDLDVNVSGKRGTLPTENLRGSLVDCEGVNKPKRSRVLHSCEPFLQTLTLHELLMIPDRSNKPILLWYEEEEISLHGLALLLISDFHRMPASHVLAASKLSIRAIHILAIAIRALIARTLGFELREVEAKALGGVVHEIRGPRERYTARVNTMQNRPGEGSGHCLIRRMPRFQQRMRMDMLEYERRRDKPAGGTATEDARTRGAVEHASHSGGHERDNSVSENENCNDGLSNCHAFSDIDGSNGY